MVRLSHRRPFKREVVTVMLALAAGKLDEEEFAVWLCRHLVPRSDGESG